MDKVKEVNFKEVKELLFCIPLVLRNKEIVLNSRNSTWHFELERNQL